MDREMLLQEIDRLRGVMEKVAEQEAESLRSPKVVAISQQLDLLIVDYYKIKHACSQKSIVKRQSNRMGIGTASI